MPKLPLLNPDDFVAIDIHTHAEEPCGLHADDGYDDFQERMAEYFKSPNKHPPTVQETAAYYRAKKIAAGIFLVDAERETGFRRYNSTRDAADRRGKLRRADSLSVHLSARASWANPMYLDDVA